MKNLIKITFFLTLLSCSEVDNCMINEESLSLTIKAEELYLNDMIDSAYYVNNMSLEIDSNNYRALNNMIVYAEKIEGVDFDQLEILKKVNSLCPNFTKGLENRIELEFELENYNYIINQGPKYLSQNFSARICLLTAKSYFLMEEFEIANNYFDQTDTSNYYPNNSILWNGRTLRKMKRYEQSILKLNQAIENLNSIDNITYHDTLIHAVYHELGLSNDFLNKRNEAIINYESALKYDTTVHSTNLNLAYNYDQFNKTEKFCNVMRINLKNNIETDKTQRFAKLLKKYYKHCK